MRLLIALALLITLPLQADDKADVAAALDAFHGAASKADMETFLAAFDEGGRFLGTDASEDWTVDDLRNDLGERFAAGRGWTLDASGRVIHLSDGGDTAWFKEILYYREGDFSLRSSGTMVRKSGKWLITQFHMDFAVPNDLYGAAINGFQAKLRGDDAEKADIGAALDSLHEMASKADWDAYFALFTKDARFIGTDASENWTIEEFRGYASGASKGWTYTPKSRDVFLSPGLDVAWFHEILWNEKYGTSRGTGALIRTRAGWKISQYHLTFPIPNDLTAEFTDRIKAFEKEK